MSDKETRVRDAFKAIHVPDTVRNRTLQAIEKKRAEEDSNIVSAPDASCISDGTLTIDSASASDRSLSRVIASPTTPTISRESGTLETLDAPSASSVSRQSRKPKRDLRSFGVKIAIAACFLAAVIGVGGFLFAALTPTAYVGIDVNPSIELGINRFNRVVEVTAYNDDGQAVLDQAQVTGMSYADALDAIADAMTDQGYLQDDSVIEVSVVCDADDLYDAIEAACVSCFDESASDTHCSRASSDEHHEASSCDMGMGKYRVYQALRAAGVDIALDDASNMTMNELYSLAESAGVDVQWDCGSEHDSASDDSSHHDSDDDADDDDDVYGNDDGAAESSHGHGHDDDEHE